LTAWFSIKAVVADCSHMHIFNNVYEEVMVGIISGPKVKGYFTADVFMTFTVS